MNYIKSKIIKVILLVSYTFLSLSAFAQPFIEEVNDISNNNNPEDIQVRFTTNEPGTIHYILVTEEGAPLVSSYSEAASVSNTAITPSIGTNEETLIPQQTTTTGLSINGFSPNLNVYIFSPSGISNIKTDFKLEYVATVTPANDLTTIFTAALNSHRNVTIYADPGVYTQTINASNGVYDTEHHFYFIGDDPETTILQANVNPGVSDAGTVLTVHSCNPNVFENITIKNFTVKNGNLGIGMNVGSSDVLLENIIIKDNINYGQVSGGISIGYLPNEGKDTTKIGQGKIILNNLLIHDNSSSSSSIIYFTGLATNEAKMNNITVTDNNAPCILLCDIDDIILENSIVWDNTASFNQIYSQNGAEIYCRSSNIQDGINGINVPPVVYENNIDTDPLFVDPANDNYRLTLLSPCMNTGDNSLKPIDLIYDIEGNNRILYDTIDMGAYETAGAAKYDFVLDDTPYCPGTYLWNELSGSDLDVPYSLIRDGQEINTIYGTGNILSWLIVNIPGTYSVYAYFFDNDKRTQMNGIWDVSVIDIGEPLSLPTVTGNVTLNNENRSLNENISIEAGGILTLNNCILHFESNVNIIVKTGGKLIINGGTLTNKCGGMWQGIIVNGNSQLPQWNESNQGVLEIKNYAIIEHAECAITVGSPLFFYNGGIVKLNNVTFTDNQKSVLFYEYQNYAFNNPEWVQPNVSDINYCTFETTDYLAGIDKNPHAQIKLFGVDGVTTFQSSFINLNPEAYDYDKRGKGVKLISANSSVLESNFQNLTYGVFTQGTSNYSVLKINENNFTDNITGIYAEAAGDYEIYDNDFDLSLYVPGTNATGIQAYYNTEAFTIEENRFTGNHSGNEAGIYAAENSANINLYKNEFSGIKSGIVLYNNPDLQVECNEFNDCNFGVYFNEDGGYWAQGTIRYPAGNKFSNNFNYHLYAWEDAYSYFHDSDLSNPLHATLTNDYVALIEVHPDYYGVNECLSHFTGGGGGGGSIEMLGGIDEEINENEILLASITDGGDTEGTNQDVDNSNPNEALKLRNKLLEKSPNLSDTVMINATMTEDILPSIMLTQVLSENPQAAKSGNLQNALDNRNNQLPYYMRDAIDQGRFSTSLKENLESENAQLRKERARIYTGLLAKYSNDTTQSSQDSLLLLMQNETDLRGRYRLMSYYMSKKDRVNAQNVFNSIPANFELSAKEENEYNAMYELNNVLFNLIDEEKSLFGVDSIQREIINTLSEDTVTYAGAYARGIMTLIDTVDHISVFPFPEENSGDKGTEPIVYTETFTVYPNPANDYFIIEYALSEKENVKDISIALFDKAGTKLMNFDVKTQANQFLAECEHLKAGIYWCRKFNKGKVTDEEKVIIKREGIINNESDVSGNSDNSSGYEIVNNSNMFKIYPNPAKDYFFITYNLKEIQAEDISIQITDMKGVAIREIELDKNTNQTKISTTSWAKGIYTISIISGSVVIENVKVIVK